MVADYALPAAQCDMKRKFIKIAIYVNHQYLNAHTLQFAIAFSGMWSRL